METTKVPESIRQAAFFQLQKMSALWQGKLIPDRIAREIKLLESIAYFDGISGLHQSHIPEKIKNPISFVIPESEMSSDSRKIKDSLHNKAIEIHTEMFLEFVKKYPKALKKLFERKNTIV